jgi:hypothetical protein
MDDGQSLHIFLTTFGTFAHAISPVRAALLEAAITEVDVAAIVCFGWIYLPWYYHRKVPQKKKWPSSSNHYFPFLF